MILKEKTMFVLTLLGALFMGCAGAQNLALEAIPLQRKDITSTNFQDVKKISATAEKMQSFIGNHLSCSFEENPLAEDKNGKLTCFLMDSNEQKVEMQASHLALQIIKKDSSKEMVSDTVYDAENLKKISFSYGEDDVSSISKIIWSVKQNSDVFEFTLKDPIQIINENNSTVVSP